MCLHKPNLHRRGLSAKEHRPLAIYSVIEPESVLHVSRRVVLGDAQSIKVVAFPFDFRPLDGLKAHLAEGAENVA